MCSGTTGNTHLWIISLLWEKTMKNTLKAPEHLQPRVSLYATPVKGCVPLPWKCCSCRIKTRYFFRKSQTDLVDIFKITFDITIWSFRVKKNCFWKMNKLLSILVKFAFHFWSFWDNSIRSWNWSKQVWCHRRTLTNTSMFLVKIWHPISYSNIGIHLKMNIPQSLTYG